MHGGFNNANLFGKYYSATSIDGFGCGNAAQGRLELHLIQPTRRMLIICEH